MSQSVRRGSTTNAVRNVCVKHSIEKELTMALAGDEKKIQALFSELALQDQNAAPTFDKLWRAAQSSALNAPAQLRRFNTVAAVITCATALLITAGALAAWAWSTRNSNPSPQKVANAVPTTPVFVTPTPRESNNATTNEHPRPHPRPKHSINRLRTKEPITTEAQILSNWQSPTNILMGSPSNIVWNSLPQLNESAAALKQFLPKHNEATKESNQ